MSSQMNVPKLRFSEFSGEWEEKKFEDIFSFSTGKNIKQNEASPEFETPCVRYGELYHMYDEVISKIINRTNLDKSELLFSQGNEILLPSAGEDPMDIGSASALTIENVAIGRTINILKPLKANIYSQIFVAYYINHKLKKNISKLAKGVSISNVYNSDLKTLKINLPYLEEQTKIANLFTAIDTKIDQLTKKQTLLKQYKKGVMQKLFSQELRFKADDGSEFSEWEEKTLGELFLFLRGSALSKSDLVDGGENKCIHYGELFTTYQEKISLIKSSTNLQDGQMSKIGDILMPSSDVTPQGLATASALFEANVIIGGDTNILRPKKALDSLFISYFLNANKNEIMKAVTGTTIKHIYNKDVAKLKINLPCLKEQTKIANFLTSIDTKIDLATKQLDATKQFKKALLQQMFV